MTKQFIAVQEVWMQSSSDYNAVRHLRTRVLTGAETIAELMQWAASSSCLQAGQVVLTVEDSPPEGK